MRSFRILAMAMVVALALVLAGCAGGTFAISSDDDGVHAKAEGVASGEGNGSISIDEKSGLCINHIVERGSFHVKATDEKGNVVFDEDLTDNIADFVDVNGDIELWLTAKNATGMIDIIAYDKEAFAQSEETMPEMLKSVTSKES